jgi:hypothetical protein
MLFSIMVAFVKYKRLAVSELLSLSLIPATYRPEIADYARVELGFLATYRASVDQIRMTFRASAEIVHRFFIPKNVPTPLPSAYPHRGKMLLERITDAMTNTVSKVIKVDNMEAWYRDRV